MSQMGRDRPYRRRRIYDDRADEGNILPIDNNIMPAENVMLENACANELSKWIIIIKKWWSTTLML